MFVKVDNLEVIYARFSIHRQAIQQIYEMPSVSKFLSICEEMILNVSVI